MTQPYKVHDDDEKSKIFLCSTPPHYMGHSATKPMYPLHQRNQKTE
jgi:hypothetical protein